MIKHYTNRCTLYLLYFYFTTLTFKLDLDRSSWTVAPNI